MVAERLKSVSWQSLAIILVSLKSFFVVKILSNADEKALMLMSQLLVTSGLLAQFSFFNFEAAFVKNLAKNDEDGAACELGCMVLNSFLFFSLVGVALWCFESTASQAVWGEHLEYGILMLYAYALIQSLNLVLFFESQGNSSHKRGALIQIGQSIGVLLSTLVFVWSDSIQLAILALILCEITVFVCCIREFRNIQIPKIVVYTNWIKANWQISASALVGGAGIWLTFNIGRYAAVEIGFDSSAIYISNMVLVSLLGFVIQPIAIVAYPEFCSGKNNPATLLKKWLQIVIPILFCVCGLLILFSSQLISVLSRDGFFIGYLFAVMTLISQLLFSSIRLFALYFVTIDSLKVPAVAFLVGGCITAFLAFPMASIYGLDGIAFSFLVGNFVPTLILLLYFFKLRGGFNEKMDL